MSIQLHINHHSIPASAGRTLFDYAEQCGIEVPTSCRKQGKCKECLLEIVDGDELLTPLTPAEAHLRGRFRLACCTQVSAQSGVVRCHTLRRGAMRVENRAFNLPLEHSQMPLDPAITRQGDRILMDGLEIDRRAGPIYGLAMDLGTTTVVLRLVNLESGAVEADASFENPQRFGGSDVMARIAYDSEHPSHLLQRTLVGYLSRAIREFPVDPDAIYEMVVAGNSTMRDMFFRLDVQPIGQNPFQSITEQQVQAGTRSTTAVEQGARNLQIPLNPKARVYGLPVISGHVGADSAACMLAVNLGREQRFVAIMDIGTNTELIVGNKDRILATSCPAGPAFEGGHITCGMPGLTGAVERVRATQNGFDLQVIGGGTPEGICGSGLVDLLAELLREGRMNPLGRYVNREKHVVLFASDEDRIILSEGDINQLAQAKGAHTAGLQIVFEQYGRKFEDLDVFYLAGGFGRYIDLDAAKAIGLIPDIPSSKIVQIGNASIEGACTVLLSLQRRRELEEIVKRVTHCRLETHPSFFDLYVDGCQFRPIASTSSSLSGS